MTRSQQGYQLYDFIHSRCGNVLMSHATLVGAVEYYKTNDGYWCNVCRAETHGLWDEEWYEV